MTSGVLGRRSGPDDYVLFPNEKRGDEGGAIRRFSGFSPGFRSVAGTADHWFELK